MSEAEVFRDPLTAPKTAIPVFVFDIDGTIADGKHRQHHIVPPAGAIQAGPGVWTLPDGTEWRKNWDAYFAASDADTVIATVAATLKALDSAGAACVYCTTRVAENIPATRAWLDRKGLPDCDIFHRPPGDFRDDTVIKVELLKEIEAAGYRVVMLFDDRKRVVLAARGAGYTVAHVAEGDY